jgi:predicted Fe-S protein YdhL (DUF1289 family)
MSVPSPCVRLCTLDQDDCCVGCGRLISEIVGWQQATPERQRQICADAEKRRAAREALLRAAGFPGMRG